MPDLASIDQRGTPPWRLRRVALALVLVALASCCQVSAAQQKPRDGGPRISGRTAGGGWSSWTIRREPVLEGQYNIAGDPSILLDGALYRMFYTCVAEYSVGPKGFDGRPGICQVVSKDGLKWDHAPVPETQTIKGLMIRGREGKWDRNIEANFVIKRGNEYLLYYSGYRDRGAPRDGFPGYLAVARSTDGLRFTRVSDEPILKPTEGWHDNDAIFSPTIVEYGDTLVMIYAAHCYTKCTKGTNVSLGAATSTDGLAWKKRDIPVLQASRDIPWMSLGVGEPHLLRGPDGMFYLFFTGLRNEERVIGEARGPSPFGPWDINPTPIVTPNPVPGFDEKAVLAPWVTVEGEVARMWYMGANFDRQLFKIRYAESRWPLTR